MLIENWTLSGKRDFHSQDKANRPLRSKSRIGSARIFQEREHFLPIREGDSHFFSLRDEEAGSGEFVLRAREPSGVTAADLAGARSRRTA
jgi:hypothetical protein